MRARWKKKTTGLNYNCASQTNFAFSIYFKSRYTVNPLHMTHVFTSDTSLKPQIPQLSWKLRLKLCLPVTVRKLQKLEISQECLLCYDQSQQRSGHANYSHKTTNWRSCLRFSFFTPDWPFSCNAKTFQKYFWCSQFALWKSSPQTGAVVFTFQ